MTGTLPEMRDLPVRLLLVALGGALGAVSRYLLNVLALHLLGGRFPWGTFAANAIGCFTAGVLLVLFTDRNILTPHHRLLLITGFLGGLTTFSAFALETLTLTRESEFAMAGANVLLNVCLGLAAVWLGWMLTRSILA